ncbi:AMP-binding protein [Bathymodiolus septemdierum thioautotrophic gill symbiont]|uniref:AMP-dependent synthetase/ligase domain-containing protein n=1 Tax=endosymbiont of Bathymodiolus septemdierum str. Myojin knoll TaxID=1303921 RepID=A0A0P0UT08_9GAMM|nr:AMP-binding protein [Bathymodiolus septemdierum thioautotrophic gill symbiont]BAS68328.1 conserved hypothetical protein [endosymbiont of Bathymodiolus septemdierum str. Myojin knoll]
MNKTFKLLNDFNENAVAIYQGRKIFKEEFLFHIELTRATLSSGKYMINLCENKYHFLVTFSACVALGKVSLFPNSKATKEIGRLSELYSDSDIINDEDVAHLYSGDCHNEKDMAKNFDIDAQQIVAVLFTSGTTGKPKENPKTWGQLNESSIRVSQRLWPMGIAGKCVVASVPPQHMFGFETSIIFPLTLGVTMHDAHPFYPLDIQQTVLETLEPKIVITTPLHLKACTGLIEGWRNIDLIISATAPLSNEIAYKTEQILGAKVFEIYGCSESGAIATRQTSKHKQWELLENYNIQETENGALLNAIGYDDLIKLSDKIKVINNRFFYLLGRSNDLIKIGGKRESLAGLSCKLKGIGGVSDGVFFIPKEDSNCRIRLAALVVSKTLTNKQIIQKLSEAVDSVFLPRPLKIVDKLPYNELGKLPLDDLIKTMNILPLEK